MGRLIKNHLARLIVLAASVIQILASIEGFIWPKVFFDFLTSNLNGAVSPAPVLQSVNLALGLLGLALEYPLPRWTFIPLAGSALHRSIAARLAIYPLSATAAVLMYQSTNAALYLVLGCGVYLWGYSEGEVCLQLSSKSAS
jgi:hypothetical protein